jgi:hypothetical protein
MKSKAERGARYRYITAVVLASAIAIAATMSDEKKVL